MSFHSCVDLAGTTAAEVLSKLEILGSGMSDPVNRLKICLARYDVWTRRSAVASMRLAVSLEPWKLAAGTDVMHPRYMHGLRLSGWLPTLRHSGSHKDHIGPLHGRLIPQTAEHRLEKTLDGVSEILLQSSTVNYPIRLPTRYPQQVAC